MKLQRLGTTAKGYGGTIYETMVDQALAGRHEIQVSRFEFKKQKPLRYLEIFSLVGFYLRYCWPSFQTIRNLETLLVPAYGKSVVILFHVDWNYSSLPSKLIQIWTWGMFRFFLSKKTKVIVIAKYWQHFLESRGFTNVELIPCAYRYEDYKVSEEEVQDFLRRCGLEGKLIVYGGNPQKKKGAFQVIEALKNLDIELVFSGESDLDLPCKVLKLSFKDYVCLLTAAQVVITNSLFKEGWNRVAHEALIVGTSVIGSGLGGMGELLEGAEQEICDPFDLQQLRAKVIAAIENPRLISGKAQKYIASFEVEKFNQQWLGIFENEK